MFGRKKAPEIVDKVDDDAEDKEVLDEEPRNILLGVISQLRKGMDLHRVTLPTFVLEPRSMLERITDFMSHPDLVMEARKNDDPVARFVGVVRYFLSGWHIRPKGVKKPYNPILGEFFKCRWQFEDGTESLYIAEQVSHHPPISSYFYVNPGHNLVITGELKPKSKFLGNSAATYMVGNNHVYFTDRPGEEYVITMPNVYAKGILFGTMLMELGDCATIKCEKTNLSCELEFKSKGFFSGTYNSVVGKIKNTQTNTVLFSITGKWTEKLQIAAVKGKAEEPAQDFFNATNASIHPKIVPPESEQAENESRRLWTLLTKNILVRNYDAATVEKQRIEESQREKSKKREADAVEYVPHFFHLKDGQRYLLNTFNPDSPDPKQAYQHLLETAFGHEPTMKELSDEVHKMNLKE